MPDIICLGEALIDMVAQNIGDLAHATGFDKAPGGAPANVAAGVGILGGSVGFIGKVGDDPWGRCLEETLRNCNVDTACLMKTQEEFTRLAFVARQQDGSHDFLFHGKRGADELLAPEDLNQSYIESASLFHFGSITTIREPARLATYAAVKLAREAGLVISYDPNLRLALWEDERQALDQMILAMELVDVVKVNREELEFLTGIQDLERGAKALFDLGPELVLVTRGAEGCFFFHSNGMGGVPGHVVEVEDTVGCGDAFVAGILLMLQECERELADLTGEDLRAICGFANAAAAITATGSGAIPALPTREEVEELLAGGPQTKDDPGF
ncbi:MAG: carbohydrate kinase family protein [Candidatus Zipacnadales bacterium]